MEEYFLKIVEKQACGLNALNINVERNNITVSTHLLTFCCDVVSDLLASSKTQQLVTKICE